MTGGGTAGKVLGESADERGSVTLAVASTVFGAMLFVSAAAGKKGLLAVAAGGLCVSIAIACIARGRVSAFFGSVVAAGVLAAGVSYLVSMLREGVYLSGRASRPSVLNAVLFLLVFGAPAAMYLWSARFGFGSTDTPDERQCPRTGGGTPADKHASRVRSRAGETPARQPAGRRRSVRDGGLTPTILDSRAPLRHRTVAGNLQKTLSLTILSRQP